MQRASHVITLQRWPVLGLAAWLVVVPTVSADVLRPFPQAANLIGYGLKPNNQTQNQLNAAITNYYASWKSNYLAASTKVVT